MRGMRLQEPPETDFEREHPSVVDSMFRVYCDTMHYSSENMEQLLHFKSSELTEFYGESVSFHKKSRPRLKIVK